MSDFNIDDILERVIVLPLSDNQIKNCELLSVDEIREICNLARDIFSQQENILKLQAPITVRLKGVIELQICGDIHGQFYDLIKLFEVGGDCPKTNYLFLGDFVDRGYFSLETAMLVILLKIRFPDRINLLRGNHESRQTTQLYGFYEECLRKYKTSEVWRLVTDLFDFLPLGCLIDDSILCLHGGLSPSISSLDQVRFFIYYLLQIASLDRFQEVPHDGAMCDLLWSDPEDRPGWEGWNESPRGAGCLFGMDRVLKVRFRAQFIVL